MNDFFRNKIKEILNLLRKVIRILFPNLSQDKISFLIFLSGYIRSILRVDFVDNVLGNRMFVDEEDTLELSKNRIYEPSGTIFCQKNVKEGNIVLDVGANMGYYTLIFANKVGDYGHVFAFEPEPQNCELLRKNVKINGYKNVTISKKAVSNVTGKGKLFINTYNKANHRIYDSCDGKKFIEIDTIRLDDYFSEFNQKIDFVKIDIEGSEYYALKGMEALLRRNSPNVVIMTEFWPKGLLLSGIEPYQYIELISDIGLEIYKIDTLNKMDTRVLLQNYTSEKGNATNLVCIHPQRRDINSIFKIFT